MSVVYISKTPKLPVMSDSYLFDTNVIFDLYGMGATSSPFRDVFSKLLNKILSDGGKVFSTTVILSEFINLTLRSSLNWYNEEQSTDLNMKRYRKTEHYWDAAQGASDEAALIIGETTFIDSNFSLDEIMLISDQVASDSLDITDLIISQICEKNDLVLVTNDADFKSTGLNIITANPKLVN